MVNMIHTYRLRYLVPFTFPDYQHLYDSLKANRNWTITDGRTEQEQDVYPFILDSFSRSASENRPGSAWLLSGSEKEGQLPALSCRRQGASPLTLQMTQAGIFLFRSLTGFFWYEFDMGKAIAPDTLVEIQNQIKELNRRSNTERFFLIAEKNIRFEVNPASLSEEKPDSGEWLFCGNPHPCYIKLSDLRQPASPEDVPAYTGRPDESLEAVRFYPDRKTGNYGLVCNALQKFSLGGWIAGELWKLSPDITFFAEKSSCMPKSSSPNAASYPDKVPDKALLFTYAVFDDFCGEGPSDEQFLEAAYELTCGYKKSYRMNPETAADMFRPFQNTLWYATRDGCGYFVKSAGDSEEFFRHNMRAKIINDYFILYILLLYQSYSLLRFSISIMENLPAGPEAYLTDTGRSMEMLGKLNCEINTFLVKGMHTSVSFVNHQNLFFRYVMEALHIEEDIKSVTVGLNALLELQNSIEKQQEALAEKQEEQQRRRADDAMNDSLGLISMLAIISAFTDGLGLISEITSILSSDTVTIANIVTLSIFAALTLLIIRLAFPAVRLYWRRHSEQKRQPRNP